MPLMRRKRRTRRKGEGMVWEKRGGEGVVFVCRGREGKCSGGREGEKAREGREGQGGGGEGMVWEKRGGEGGVFVCRGSRGKIYHQSKKKRMRREVCRRGRGEEEKD